MAGTRNMFRFESRFTDLMIFRQRWWQHLLFWVAVFLILLNIFKTSSTFERIDLIYTLIFLTPLLGMAYLNLYVLIPRFLGREKYLIFVLLFLGLAGAGALFLYLLFDRWIDLVLPNYYFISYYSVGQLMIYTGSVLLLTTLLKLSRSWFMMLRVERLTASHQLKSLQSQINPHFLLNSLQTIYALALDKSDRTPDVILRLSEILKYTLYETGHARISLEQEIGLLRDYTEMYRDRVDPVRADIRLDVEGDTGDLEIAPMLLIPFVENSFKHGLQGESGSAFVHVRLDVSGHTLTFITRNNRGETDRVVPETRQGIGIENTRQRLELIYPGRHRLDIKANGDAFEVNLKIELKT
jgi:sensor histidine kinase YesM